jgi:acetyltransferase-like isoleucine patch superfamily enzyme
MLLSCAMSFLRKLVRLFRKPSGGVSGEESLRRMETAIAEYRRNGVVIGEGCYIHGVLFPGGDPIEIGDDCVLTYCTILGHDASPALFLPELRGGGLLGRISLKKKTVIHDRCFIGVQAVVLCGVQVGPGSIVAAGAVVTHDVPPGAVVAGNPAHVICTVAEFTEKHRRTLATHPELYPGYRPA